MGTASRADHGRRGLVPRVARRARERRPLGTDRPNPSEVSGTEIPVVSTLAPPRPGVTDRARDSPLDKARRGGEPQLDRGPAPRSLKLDSARPRPQTHSSLALVARSPRPHVHTPAALPFLSARPTRGRPGLRGVPPLGGSRVGVGWDLGPSEGLGPASAGLGFSEGLG